MIWSIAQSCTPFRSLMNQKHRDQIADLILKDQDGHHLEVASNLEAIGGGTVTFEIIRPPDYPCDVSDLERYRVTIKIEEL